jgi:hypothetical protein
MTESDWLACTEPQPMIAYLRGKASDRKMRLFYCVCCRRIWHLIADPRGREAVETAERFADGLAGQAELQQSRRSVRFAVSEAKRSEWEGEAETNFGLGGPLDYGEYLDRMVRLFAVCAAQATVCKEASDAYGDWMWYQNPEMDDPPRLFDPQRASDYWAAAAVGRARYRVLRPTEEARQLGELAGQAESAEQVKLVRDLFGNPFRPIDVDPAWLTWRDGTVRRLAEVIYEDRRFADLPVLADALEEAGCTDAHILDHCRGGGEHVRGCWVVDALLGKG